MASSVPEDCISNTRLLMEQKSASVFLFLFVSPSPCLPISRSLSVLFGPTIAFMSPIKMSMSRFEVLLRADCSWV